MPSTMWVAQEFPDSYRVMRLQGDTSTEVARFPLTVVGQEEAKDYVVRASETYHEANRLMAL